MSADVSLTGDVTLFVQGGGRKRRAEKYVFSRHPHASEVPQTR